MRRPIAVLGAVAISSLIVGSTLASDKSNAIEVQLSSAVEDYAVAGSGRFLVLKEAGEPRLTVYDTRAQAVSGHLDVGSTDHVVGAGGAVALVFVCDHNQLQCWDIEKLTRINSRTFDERLIVTHIIMGHSRDDLAILRLAPDLESDRQWRTTPMSLRCVAPRECAPIGFGLERRNARNEIFRDYVHFRATGDLRRFTQWCTSSSPSGVGLHLVEGQRLAQALYHHTTKGNLPIGEDGDIYTGKGEVLRFLDPSARSNGVLDPVTVVCNVSNRSLIPGVDGVLFLGVSSSGQIELYRRGNSEPLCSIGDFPQWSQRAPQPSFASNFQVSGNTPDAAEEWIKARMTFDRRIIFSPSLGFVVFLPYSNRMIIQRRFDIRETLEASGKDYLLTLNLPETSAISGTLWRHQMAVLAKHRPVEFSLELAPQGMTVSTEGELSWRAPNGTRGEADVIFVVRDAKGKTLREEFSIRFAPGKAESRAQRF